MKTLTALAFGDLSREYAEMKIDIDVALDRVLSSGRFILGQEVERFEASFAAYLGTGQTIGVASGTEAISLALLAAGVGHGDEVLTVSFTAPPTAAAITAIGATPRFVDVMPDACLMDVSKLEKAITPRTKAVIPVHLYGQCADMDAVMAIARPRGLCVIEDCAHAHGALYKGKKAGTFGTFGAFSFYPSKNLGCYGDGGAVVTSDAALAEKIRMLRNYGQKKRSYHELRGLNSRLDEMQAAILSAKLPRLERWNQRRRQLAELYTAGLAGLPLKTQKLAPQNVHVYHLYAIFTSKRDALRTFMTQEGVETLDHYAFGAHEQPAYCDKAQAALPVTETLARQVATLPLYPQLKDDEAQRVIECIRRFFA